MIPSQVAKSFDSESGKNCIERHSAISCSVRFDCNDTAEGVNYWKYNGENIYINDNIISSAVKDVEIYSNYSLFIANVSIDHEGLFQCIRNAVEVTGYCLYVKVFPTLKISVIGQNSDIVQFESNEELVVRCQAFGSRPATDLTWRVNGRLVNATENLKVQTFDNRTFDTDSVLRFHPQEANGTVTCSDSQQQVQEVKITYFKFASPKRVSLLFDREDVVKSVAVYYGKSYNVSCVARAARPPVTLTLIIDNVTLSPSDVYAFTVPRDDNPAILTYDSWIEMEYKPTEGNHTFTCLSSGEEPQQERRTSITVHVLAYEESFEDTSDKGLRILPLISSALVVIILLILSTISCLLWRRKVRSAERPRNFGVIVARLDEQSLTRKASIIASPKTPKSEGSVKESAFTYEFGIPPQVQHQTETKAEHQNPPKLKLPDVPYVEGSNSKYENPCVTEGVYYSDLKDEVAVGRLFHRQEMCLILSLKAGKVHNRWMGSIAATNDMTKCVFVSTVTEHILRTREIQWDVYVKRILELPKSNSLTNTEGICIDGAQLYLVQEHFTCVPLNSHIQSNRREAGDGTSYTTFISSDIRKWVVDILKGMEIVHSYGLLHPGLSTKKILLTNDNVLKLYDFCLSDDAQRKVLLLKDKMNCSLNQLAPEALLRNEYTVTSDVWSIAVVIWELLTATAPFPEDSQVVLNRSGSLFHGSWPSKYADLRNNYVFDCWRQDCTIRPTMRQLRFSFDEDDESSERNVLTEGSEPGMADQYVPMKAIIQAQRFEESITVQIKKATPKDAGKTIQRQLKGAAQDENKKSNSV